MDNKKKTLIIVVLVTVFVLIVGIIAIKIYLNLKNQKEIDTSIHAVVIGEDVPFYQEAKTDNVKQIRLLKKGEEVYILDEFEENGVSWSKVKVDGRINGFVRTENIQYFEEINSERVLVSDVSKFNFGTDFKSKGDYEVFLLKNNISYVYIRAGGRGYGTEGNMYEDSNFQVFVDACEFLGVPYGFYFLDEALNSEEIDEEVEFIKEFLSKYAGENCKLPVALDIEKHNGEGRADDIWNDRAKLVQELIDKLEKENIDTIVYSNAQTANLYLSSLSTRFWISYYPEDDLIPDYWYFDIESQEGASNVELNKKTIGWQFSETGAGDEVTARVDLSLFNKDFFAK